MSTPKSKRKQHPHRQSTKKSRKQPSRHEILTSPANEVQNLLPPEQVKVVTKRGLGLNDYGFQRNASKSIYPYSQIILAPSNAIQYLERSKWSKSIQLLDLSNNDIQTLPKESKLLNNYTSINKYTNNTFYIYYIYSSN